MIKNLSLIALTITLAAPMAAAQSSIEQVAPENTVILLGVNDVSRSIERFKRTPLHELWNSPEMKEVRADLARDMEGEVMTLLREMGLEDDEAIIPSGAGGLAVFTVVDPETGAVKPAFVAFADYGANADQVARVVQNFLERGERDGEIEYEEREILGRTVYSVDKVQEEEEFDGMDEDEFGFDPMAGPDFDLQTLHYVRNGGALMVCSDLGSLTEALDRLDNGGKSALTDREDYRTIMDRVGARDAHFVLLTRDLMQIIAAADTSGMASMFGPMAKSIIGDIAGLGTSVQLDGPQAMVEQAYFISMPNGKAGLTKLVDAPAPRENLPPYVGGDAIGFTSVAFQFDRVAEVAREAIQSNPMLGMIAQDAMPMIDGPVNDLLSTLGSRIQIMNSLTRPITMESIAQLFAIEVKRPQDLEDQIAMWAPQAGMESRDFLGHRIFAAPDMAMGPMEIALGLGGGFLFAGPERDVQQGLRSTADRDRAGALANDPNYQRAIALLPAGPVVMWGYSDLVSSFEMGMSMGLLSQQEMMEQLRRDHPELAEEMDGMEMDDADGPFGKIDPELLRRYIGPSSWQLQSTDEGFIGHAFILSAE